MLLHPVTFSNANTFCRCKSLRQIQVDVAVQFTQLFLTDGSLHFYSCCPKILGQQDGTVHAFKVNRMLIALSASPSASWIIRQNRIKRFPVCSKYLPTHRWFPYHIDGHFHAANRKAVAWRLHQMVGIGAATHSSHRADNPVR